MADPIFTIDTPTSNPTYSTALNAVLLGGTIQETDYPILSAQWYNDQTGQGGDVAVAGGRWSATVPLAVGLNHVSAWATDSQGNITGRSIDITSTPSGLPQVQYATQSYVWTFSQLGNVTPTQWHLKWGTTPGNHPNVVTYPAATLSARLNTVLPGAGTYYAVICAYDGLVEWAVSPEFGCEAVVSGPPVGVLVLRVQ